MAMNPRPFRVLIVATDRKLLRRLSRFLEVFGYDVQQVTSLDHAKVATDGISPDFLVIDSDATDKQALRNYVSVNRDASSPEYIYTFLMVRGAADDELKEAIEAGVDDFLTKPLVYGELLARMRAGARVMEYERRVLEQSAIDPRTGLLNRSAFATRLKHDAETMKRFACVVIDVDFFANINHRFGFATGNHLLATVATTIKGMAREAKYVASFGSGRFAALLPDMGDAEGIAWAENVRLALADVAIEAAGSPISITVSCGVSGGDDAAAAETCVDRSIEAVRSAKASGRNCVARCGQFDGETREWEDLATQGKLFENTTARDIMTPCTLTVRSDDQVAHAAALLKQTRINAMPVVDAAGRLVGLIDEDDVARVAGRKTASNRTVADVMTEDVRHFQERTGFNDLLEFFTSQQGSVVVIVRADRPVGIVHCRGLAALSEPLNTNSFAPKQPFSAGSEFLLVPDG